MSPLPGAPRGNAPPRAPHRTRPHRTGPRGTPPGGTPTHPRPTPTPRTPTHHARHLLAALLLTVLTLLGGAPAAAGAALPVPRPGAMPGAGSAASAYAAGSAASAFATGSPALAGAPAATAARAAGSAVPAYSADSPSQLSGPTANARQVLAWWAEAVPLPGPRAGADRPHAPPHVPPPGHGALPPRPQGLPSPRGIAPGAADAGSLVVVRVWAALPGVRGPPEVKAARTAPHRPRSPEPSPRPSH